MEMLFTRVIGMYEERVFSLFECDSKHSEALISRCIVCWNITKFYVHILNVFVSSELYMVFFPYE